MATDLERAYDALVAKNLPYTDLWRYADGDHPLVYLAARLKEVFRSLPARFTQNWCSVVLAALLERVELTGFSATDKGVTDALEHLWHDQNLELEADNVHQAEAVCGEAFLVIWPDDDNVPQAYYNDPRLCVSFYDAENPRTMTCAAKWWDDDSGYRRLTLYYPDRLEYYISRTRADAVSSAASFMLVVDDGENPANNPYGVIPVFHFRKSRRATLSDLTDAIPLQNGINKLLTDMMVAAEYQALPQRFVISQVDMQGKLKNAANEIWNIPASDGTGQQTSAGQFSAGDLGAFLNAIDRIATSIAVITRTPKHYFFSQSGDPSGEALIVQEAPLNKKAGKRIKAFSPTWRQAAAFMLLVQGVAVDPEDITPLFTKPETVQPLTMANIRNVTVQAGVPLVTALRWEGKTQTEIDEMQQDQKKADAANKATMAQAMLDAQRQFNAGDTSGNGGNGGNGKPTEESAPGTPGARQQAVTARKGKNA